MSLAQAARRAVCLAPSLRLADAQAQLEQGALSERRARLQPEWSLSATPARSHQWGTEPVARSTSASGSIAVSQVLFDGGARAARVQQGEQDLLAAAEDRRSSELDAVLAFVDLWVQFRNAEAGAASARDRARGAWATAVTVQARQNSGLATAVDLLQARSSFAQAERDALVAATELRRARGVLAQRLGLPADAALSLTGDDLAALQALPALTGVRDGDRFGDRLAALLEAQTASNPQIGAQRARLAALQSSLAAARADSASTWTLTGQTGPSWSRGNATSPSGQDTTARRWNAEVGLRWSMSLSDGGARDARAAQALAQIEAGRARLEQLQRDLADTLWQRLGDWRDADAAAQASDLALQAAQAAEAAAASRYRAGAGILTDVLNAQADLAQRARQRSEAEQQRLRSQAALLHTLGTLPIQLNLGSQ